MEPRFGHDFSRVRVHTDGRAAESAQAVNAQAYTVGNKVVFGSDQYQPGSTVGSRLLAHELAHVVQQSQGGKGGQDQIALDEPNSVAERQAEQVSRNLHILPSQGGGQLQRVASILQRQDAPDSTTGPSAVPSSCEAIEPDPDAVTGIIEDGLGGMLSATYSATELQVAWIRIRNQRETPDGSNCCSSELAAAEHYLFARFSVVNLDFSPVEMKALIFGYGYLKRLVPKTGICPRSPDTQGSRDWGYRGADDGATDLFNQNLAQNTPANQTGGDQTA
jgi:hypothetical protein